MFDEIYTPMQNCKCISCVAQPNVSVVRLYRPQNVHLTRRFYPITNEAFMVAMHKLLSVLHLEI